VKPALDSDFIVALTRALEEGVAKYHIQSVPHLVLLDSAFYRARLAPILAKWSMRFFTRRHMITTKLGADAGKDSNALSCAGVSSDDIVAFLLRKPQQEPELERCVSAALSPHTVMMLNLGHDWLTAFLPHCLSKINRVSYGLLHRPQLSPGDASAGTGAGATSTGATASSDGSGAGSGSGSSSTRMLTAVPFVGKDVPSPASEYAHPDVVIGLTILAYRYEGLRRQDVKVLLTHLKQSFNAQTGPKSQRPDFVRFEEWLAGGDSATPSSTRPAPHQYHGSAHSTASRDGAGGVGGSSSSSSSLFGSRVSNAGHGAGASQGAYYRDVPSLEFLQPSDESQLAKAWQVLHRHPATIAYFLFRHVFPACSKYQRSKLQASGQDVGSAALFRVRLGFSGTPSSLLPSDLGDVQFEPGSEGKVVHYLSAPSVVMVIQLGPWDVRSLLLQVAQSPRRYHALIDAGALVTGMSNLDVARFLLRHGLEGMDGCVYLDQFDRERVVLRGNPQSLHLRQCGIPPHRRFTFYDQVHTTGIDIKQTGSARAAVTLGKDMTMRDFAQGCWRMRSIGHGQTLDVLVTPGVSRIIRDSGDASPPAPSLATAHTGDMSVRRIGEVTISSVLKWLVRNSMHTERLQYRQLCWQETAHTWRSYALGQAYARLGDSHIHIESGAVVCDNLVRSEDGTHYVGRVRVEFRAPFAAVPRVTVALSGFSLRARQGNPHVRLFQFQVLLACHDCWFLNSLTRV